MNRRRKALGNFVAYATKFRRGPFRGSTRAIPVRGILSPTRARSGVAGAGENCGGGVKLHPGSRIMSARRQVKIPCKAHFPFTFFEKLVGFVRSSNLNGNKMQPMKKYFPLICALAVTVIVAPLRSGAQPAPATVSASKTSFAEVTAQLDPGGNFFLYLGTAQWLEHLSANVEKWRHTFASMPDAKPDDATNISKAFDIVTRLITDSGVETISGAGLSSIEIEKGLYRNKMLLHHYPGKGDGFLWKLCGGPPHALSGLDLLPANTALAIFADADLPLLWNVTKTEVAKSGFPQADDFLQQLPTAFEKNTQVKWDTFIHSLGGEFGIAVTLDESNNVPIPLPSGAISIPEPGILIAIRVNDDIIFNRIAEELKKNKEVINYETNNVRMRTMPVPIPMAINLRPTAATSGGYLFIASSDTLVSEVLAVKSGEKTGLKTTAEFKHLAQGLPEKGNQFSYISARFGRTVMEIQKQAIAGQGAQDSSQAQLAWVKSLFSANDATYSYSVGVNTPDGCLTIGNGNQSAAALVLLPAVAVMGGLAAIAIPNFVKARTTAQQNGCINNLRQIDAAENQWALEKGKKTGDVCTEDDVKPYIRLINGTLPKCPQGGHYTIGPVGEAPTCSIPGHQLQ